MTDGVSTKPSVDVARLRAATPKKQSQIAAEAGIETSRMSRIESGQITPNDDEVERILKAIGTPQAEEYRAFSRLAWSHLPKPTFWHPDRKALAQAEEALAELEELAGTLDAGSPLNPQLNLYARTIRESAHYLHDVTHDIVPIGPIGVGKTTATAALTGLILPDPSLELDERIVLETGQGRTTICEVVICRGPEYAIRVEPYSEGEVRQLVRDFCAALFNEATTTDAADREEGVGEEVERALRNMSGLTYRLEKGAGPQRNKIDTAIETLGEMATTDERRAAFMTRIDHGRRTTTQLRHDPASGVQPLEWLKDTYLKVNHGLLPDVPLPRRIEVQIPRRILGDEEYELRWADTKGIDKTAIRPDLQKRLEDPRSLLIMCSGFADAPGSEAQSLIEHAIESGLRSAVDYRTLFLALPHDGEARKMKDPVTMRKVKTDEEGYEEKARQVQDSAICRRYSLQVPTLFFNATSEEDCRVVPCQLRDAVRRMRQHHTDQIEQVSQAVRQVIADLDRARTEAAQREVNRQLQLFLRQNQALTERTTPAYMYLIGAAQVVNPQSLKASVRRRGDWDNFDVYLHLATGAAREAQARSARFFNRLEGLLSQMMADENLEPTHRFLGRLAKSAVAWREQFVAEARQVGGEIFRAALEDADVWHDCGFQRAPDYRLKVARLLHNWFMGPPSEPDLVRALEHHIQAEWECQVLDEFRRLCEEVAACPAEQPAGSAVRAQRVVHAP